MTKKIKLRRKKCVCIYAGSTVQQNFGESRLKGYLMWNIHSKDKHSVEKRLFQSPRPFITVHLNQDGTLPNEDVPKNSRLRLVCGHNIPTAKLKRACDYAQVKWSTHSVSFVNNSNTSSSVSSAKGGKAINMRDPANQEKFLREFMETKEIEESVRERVVELSREYLKKVDNSGGVSRNVVWDIKKMQWNYLFNYGKGNTLDFSKLNGLVGIFGKNYSGKSSIIDAALFGLFNTTSKGERKNVHIINQNQERALCKLEIAVGDDVFKINRSLEKTTGRSKGREVVSAKTELDFTKYTLGTRAESKNGDTRNQTDENIRNTFGSLEDFMMTSLAAQNDSFGFINEGSTKRKEILAKFLDLQIFDQMHKLAKQDSSEMRGVIKHLNSIDWEKKLSRAQEELSEILEDIDSQKSLCTKHTARLEVLLQEQQLIQDQVKAASQRDLDIVELEARLQTAENALKKAQGDLQGYETTLASKMQEIADLESLLPVMQDKAREAKEEMASFEIISSEVSELQPKVKRLVRQIDNLQSKIDMLHDHEYDPNCKFCCDNEFVKAAEQAKIDIVSLREEKELKSSDLLDLKMKASLFDTDDLTKRMKAYDSQLKIIKALESDVETLRLRMKNSRSQIEVNNQKIEKLNEDIAYYNANAEAYENLTSLRRDLQAITKSVDLKKSEIKRCEDKVLEFMSEKGSVTRSIEEAGERIQQIQDAERDYIAYDIFVQATHANGISYEVIKSMLPIINEEIQKVLSSIVEFEVFFAEDGDKLEIYLKHPKYDARPLSMGSGAEKTIASMAVRLALISVSSLPKSQLFILDEPATALDADHMEGFVRLLQMIKAQFKTVLLITHLENLKDIVDTTIEIDKTDGYAQVKL